MKIQPTDIHSAAVERAQNISPTAGTQAFEAVRILQIRYEVEEELRRQFTLTEYVRGGIEN